MYKTKILRTEMSIVEGANVHIDHSADRPAGFKTLRSEVFYSVYYVVNIKCTTDIV